jgi:phage tail-like protein
MTMTGRLLEHLPAIYREGAAPGTPNAVERFLAAFAKVLLGSGDAAEPGLEERIAGLPRYFDAGAPTALDGATPSPESSTPKDFLPWLARWIALTLREDWGEARQRFLIGHAARLYRLRGTKRGLEELLAVYTSLPALVDERSTPFQVEKHSQVGVDTLIGGGQPLFFYVKVKMKGQDYAQLGEQEPIIRALVDLQKPAHTQYRLEIDQLQVFEVDASQVGINTTLG